MKTTIVEMQFEPGDRVTATEVRFSQIMQAERERAIGAAYAEEFVRPMLARMRSIVDKQGSSSWPGEDSGVENFS